MVSGFPIHEGKEGLQLVVGRKDWIEGGAASVGKPDPDFEANGWYGHRDIS